MLKIAVISDDVVFLDSVKPLLTKEGYKVHLYPLCQDGLSNTLLEQGNELIIIDFFSRPKASGGLVKELKEDEVGASAYCICVLDSNSEDDIDFRSGIDDFIFRDSIKREIKLKVRLFFWKSRKIDSEDKIIVPGFVIDNANYEVIFQGEKVDLTFKEFELLKFFITHRGRVYSRDALLSQVWDYNYYGGTRTVDVHVRRIRAKLGGDIDRYLKTIRNVGYKFEL